MFSIQNMDRRICQFKVKTKLFVGNQAKNGKLGKSIGNKRRIHLYRMFKNRCIVQDVCFFL